MQAGNQIITNPVKEASTAVFIMSCDRTADVAIHFIKSFDQYWPDCPYPVFIGVNKITDHVAGSRYIPIAATAGNWKIESTEQVTAIRSGYPNIKSIVLFLDDFILSRKVNTPLIKDIVEEAGNNNISYLGLKPTTESFFRKTTNQLVQSLKKKTTYHPVRKEHPYYSSLQVAVWNIDYLLEMLEKAAGIWHFENIKTDTAHHAVTRQALYYRHVVEKGEWDFTAREYCQKHIFYFEPGNRKFRQKKIGIVSRIYLAKASFFFFGYSLSNIKKILTRFNK